MFCSVPDRSLTVATRRGLLEETSMRPDAMNRREFLKAGGGIVLAGVSCAYAVEFLTAHSGTKVSAEPTTRRYGMVIDLTKCLPD